MNDSPLGAFEEHILLAVAQLHDAAYGMAVRRLLEQATERDLSIGAVYSTLDRLERKGLVTSARKDLEGRSRRLFELTERANEALRTTRSMRRRLWLGVQLPDPA